MMEDIFNWNGVNDAVYVFLFLLNNKYCFLLFNT